MDLLQELKWRQVVYDQTEGLKQALQQDVLTGYIGFDPTAASLHVGNLLPLVCLARFQRFGNKPIALAGGGTGLIGDPSGKTAERRLLSPEKVEEHLEAIQPQLARLLDFDSDANPARIINNADWLSSIPLIEFLRDIGKHFTVNSMLAKESVKRRIQQEEGISYTEFSYMLLQAYDFVRLYESSGCTLQMGGSDQWGNITAGIDLVRRLHGVRTYGLVFPLVKSSSGHKFGKTEAGAVWLDSAMTSPYRFYQFWLNTDDRDVVNYLRYFTWLTREEISELGRLHQDAPQKREAHRRLAEEVTRLVHGRTERDKAIKASQALFGGDISGLTAQEIEEIFSDVPSSHLEASRLDGGLAFLDILVHSGLSSSKGEARRLIQGGGAYLNNRRASDVAQKVTHEDCIDGRFVILRKGAKNHHLLRIGSPSLRDLG